MSTAKFDADLENNEWTQSKNKANEALASVGGMVSHAVSAAEQLTSQALTMVAREIDQLAARAGSGIHEFGNRLEQNLPHNGALGTASRAIAGAVQGSGEYLEDQKLSGMARDLTGLIRRNPIPVIIISIGLGWFIARKIWK